MPRGTSGFRRVLQVLRYRVTFARKERLASAGPVAILYGCRRDWAPYTYIGCLAGRSRSALYESVRLVPFALSGPAVVESGPTHGCRVRAAELVRAGRRVVVLSHAGRL